MEIVVVRIEDALLGSSYASSIVSRGYGSMGMYLGY